MMARMMIQSRTNLSGIILSAQQVRDWDAFTIENEPISSIDLMERASEKAANWIMKQTWQNKTFRIFCGKGNNGGDGLAIARFLMQAGNQVSIYILEKGDPGSKDFEINLQRLRELPADIHFIQTPDNFPAIGSDEIVIDAIFGSGLNKPVEDVAAELIIHINSANAPIIAIDIPSGLYIDQSSLGNKIIEANHTLTFQCYKPAFVVQENAPYTGELHVLDIGLHAEFLKKEKFDKEMLNAEIIKSIYRPRNRFAHKGNFGHALLIGGSYGKMGAAILAAKACLHSGVGLLTCF
ncbi:MAG: NAD(P)H-hydrate epimerase, partial [Flavisolibacter sp.]